MQHSRGQLAHPAPWLILRQQLLQLLQSPSPAISTNSRHTLPTQLEQYLALARATTSAAASMDLSVCYASNPMTSHELHVTTHMNVISGADMHTMRGMQPHSLGTSKMQTQPLKSPHKPLTSSNSCQHRAASLTCAATHG
jgi:hypothetical protein